jgi:hypothetical protein
MWSKLVTTIVALPALVRRLDGTVTVQEVAVGAAQVAQLKDVVTPQNFQATAAVLVSPVPLRVSTTGLELPAVAVPVMLVIAGGSLMVNGEVAELTPSLLTTLTSAEPAAENFEEGTVTVQAVALQDDARASDPQKTWYPLAKPVPLMVNGTDELKPAVATDGERLPITGGAAIVKVSLLELTLIALTTVI